MQNAATIFFSFTYKKVNYRGVALLLFLAQVKNWSKNKNMNREIEVIGVLRYPYHGLGLFMILGSCLFLIWFVSLSRYFGWVSPPPFRNDATCLQVLYRYMYIKIGSNNRNVHLIYLYTLHQVVFYHVSL